MYDGGFGVMRQIRFLFLFASLAVGVCHAQDITIIYNGAKASVRQTVKDSVSVTSDGAVVNIESTFRNHKFTLLLKGKSDNGQLVLKTRGKAKVTLSGLDLTSQEGAVLHLKNKKKVEIVAAKGTQNTLTITACKDTANHKAACIWAKDKIQFSGKGVLNVIATGDGCRGVKSKKDITVNDLTLNVTTSGNNLGEKAFSPPAGPPVIPQGGPKSLPSGRFEGGHAFPGNFPPFQGGRPDFGTKPDSIGRPDFPQMPEGGGFGGKHKYVASAKGIASKRMITVNSGNISVRTSTAGAEGIEAKQGIVFNGGSVYVMATDDAINADSCIVFNGADVTAISTGNDAVDSNPKNGAFSPFGSNEQSDEPAIIIRGGTVYAWSQVGSPEEGLDCDFATLVIEGGKVFSVGGGMGEMPSVPTNQSASQPTVLLSGINIVKDEPVQIYDAEGKLLDAVTVPFSLRRSASILSSPSFKLGNTYTVRTQNYQKTFTLNENFTVVR